jgi:hypothetical protein
MIMNNSGVEIMFKITLLYTEITFYVESLYKWKASSSHLNIQNKLRDNNI